MKSQIASPTFTPIFAALVSVINTKFPETGELLLHRLILQVHHPSGLPCIFALATAQGTELLMSTIIDIT